MAHLHAALSSTGDLQEEVRALGAPFPSRDADILYDRWGLAGTPHGMSALAEHYGLSRERVRLIVRLLEARIEEAGPALPFARLAADSLSDALAAWSGDSAAESAPRGEGRTPPVCVPSEAWARAAAHRGLALDEGLMFCVAALGRLGLVPPVRRLADGWTLG